MKLKSERLYDITLCLYILFAVVTDTGSAPMKLARLFLVGIWGIKILFDRRITIAPYVLRMIPFWIMATLTVLWAEDTDYATAMSKTLMLNIMCMCALIGLMDDKKERLDLALKTLVFAPLLLELRVVMKSGFLAYMNARMIDAISGNTVGMCAAFGACIAVYYWLKGDKKYGLLFVINTAILILSASRKALVCVAVPIMILYLLDTRIDRKKRIFRCVFLLAAGVIGLWLMMRVPALYQLIGWRIEGLLQMLLGNAEQADPSSYWRSLMTTKGLEYFAERPLLGYGADCYRFVMRRFDPDWKIYYYSHNNYVELLVGTGIFGMVLYYWNYVKMLAMGWKNRSLIGNRELLGLGILITLMIAEIGLVSYYKKDIQVLLVLIWMLLSESDQAEKKRKLTWEWKSRDKNQEST